MFTNLSKMPMEYFDIANKEIDKRLSCKIDAHALTCKQKPSKRLLRDTMKKIEVKLREGRVK